MYLWGANLVKSVAGILPSYYLYNAHGDVVQLTGATGTVIRSYDYDAFGVEAEPDPADTNPFRYCCEYYDKESSTYYLRVRYYDPTLGRFTQADTHWHPGNMINGDNPVKINEHEDSLGLVTYAYAPQSEAISQSNNLYVYAINSPIRRYDNSGNAMLLGMVSYEI